MSTERLDDTIPAWPNQTEAAEVLRISESALLRSPVKIVTVSAGREKRISPESIIELALHYKRVSLTEVVGRLLELADQKYPAALGTLEPRLDDYVERRAKAQPVIASEIRALLERSLSPRMLREVLGALERGPLVPADPMPQAPAGASRANGRKSGSAAEPKVGVRRSVGRARA